VKLLFDENLSRKLVVRLVDIFGGSRHVFQEGLLQSQDIEIWEYAHVHGFTTVTVDADFYDPATRLGSPQSFLDSRMQLVSGQDREDPSRSSHPIVGVCGGQ
jgi:predicted nuclease of predicted toxin-antitoxin system